MQWNTTGHLLAECLPAHTVAFARMKRWLAETVADI
jgi:hypothetical protein